MNRSENHAADRLDSSRARTKRSSRDRAIEARARQCASAFIGLNDKEQASFARALVRECRASLMEHEGPVEAAAFLSQQSYEAAKGLLPGKIARAAAEQAFAKLGRAGE